jgi:hypothetical protein
MVLHKNKRKYLKYMTLLFKISRFFPNHKNNKIANYGLLEIHDKQYVENSWGLENS